MILRSLIIFVFMSILSACATTSTGTQQMHQPLTTKTHHTENGTTVTVTPNTQPTYNQPSNDVMTNAHKMISY